MRLPLRSPMVSLWLYFVAILIVAIVMVGGATRLTDSGLSITEWRPLHGALPPLNDADWASEFSKYQQIPEFSAVNPDMTVDTFKTIYWWEWAHRQLGRFIGLAILLPFIYFLAVSEMPRRMIWRGALLVAMVIGQGALGWWMVSSGLSSRVDVAPERLTIHMGTAVLMFVFTLWSAFEAYEGQSRSRGAPLGWKLSTWLLLVFLFVQLLLGALVAGNRAGLVYNDWPLMNGAVFPVVDWAKGVGYSFVHDQGLVQFVHRCMAYFLLVYVVVYALIAARKCYDRGLRALSFSIAILTIVQAGIGIATLITGVMIGLALLHQLMAVILIGLATVLVWQVMRADRAYR